MFGFGTAHAWEPLALSFTHVFSSHCVVKRSSDLSELNLTLF